MRWARLFADLESQLDALAGAEADAEVGERTRVEISRLRLVDRLRAAEGHPLEARCAGAGPVRGRLDRVGADWILLAEAPDREALLPLASVLAVTGLGRWSAAPGSEGTVAARLGLRSALRGIVRDRAPVHLALIDGSTVAGTVDRVGADFVELAEHAPGEPRRAASVRTVRTVPLHGLGVLRRW